MRKKGGGSLLELEATGILTQEVNPGDKMLVDDRNGFNYMRRLAMLLTMLKCWTAGARFTLSCYKHWSQILLHRAVRTHVTLLRQECVNQV